MASEEVYPSRQITTARLREIALLPPEHKDHFLDKSRFSFHNANAMGSHARRVFPGVHMRPEQSMLVDVFLLGDAIRVNPEVRARILSLGLHEFYREGPDALKNLAEYIGPFLTILGSYMTERSYVESGLDADMISCHLKIERRILQTVEELNEVSNEALGFIMEIMGNGDVEDLGMILPVIAISIFILLGKNITDKNRDQWFRNRWRAFASVVNVKFPENSCPIPTLDACTGVYQTLASRAVIRAKIFRIYQTLAAAPHNSNAIYFERVLALLQWAEMGSLWTILRVIFDENKEVLSYPELHGPEISPMLVAIRLLKSYPLHERPFLKLLYEQTDLKPLQARNYPKFTAAAHAIANMDSTSMKNMQFTNVPDDLAEFQNRVKDFVRSKRNMGGMLASHSYAYDKAKGIKERLLDSLEGCSSDKTIVSAQLSMLPEVSE